jgi:hypothetical protein
MSIIGSGLGLYMSSVYGEFDAEVYSGATTEARAWEVFRPAEQILKRTPELKSVLGSRFGPSRFWCRATVPASSR